jgi:hypothetical protein
MIYEKTCEMPDSEKSSEEYSNEEDYCQKLSFELTNRQLTQAILYSEILGKPKCKTRRRR